MIQHTRMTFRQIRDVIPPTAAANLTSTYGMCDKTISCYSGNVRIHPSIAASTLNGFLLSAGEALDVLCDTLFIATSAAGLFQAVIWE